MRSFKLSGTGPGPVIVDRVASQFRAKQNSFSSRPNCRFNYAPAREPGGIRIEIVGRRIESDEERRKKRKREREKGQSFGIGRVSRFFPSRATDLVPFDLENPRV